MEKVKGDEMVLGFWMVEIAGSGNYLIYPSNYPV
jgi:hypothetical protein